MTNILYIGNNLIKILQTGSRVEYCKMIIALNTKKVIHKHIIPGNVFILYCNIKGCTNNTNLYLLKYFCGKALLLFHFCLYFSVVLT